MPAAPAAPAVPFVALGRSPRGECLGDSNAYHTDSPTHPHALPFPPAQAPRGGKALFFRILHVRPAERVLVLRLERFNLYWQRQPVTLGMNSTLEVASGAWARGVGGWGGA